MKFSKLLTNRRIAPLDLRQDHVSFSFLWEGEADTVMVTLFDETKALLAHEIPLSSSCAFTLPFEYVPGVRYSWEVRAGADVSKRAFFEIAKPLQAPWITPPVPVTHPVMVRHFAAGTGSARLYLTGLGLYHASLNGHEITEGLLTPGFTEYQKQTRYQVYDVTNLLEAENTLRVTLADGWYKGLIGLNLRPDVYGDAYLLCGALYQNGELLWETDEEFLVYSSRITSSGIYDGETIDATLEEKPLGKAVITAADYPLVPQNGPLIQIAERKQPTLIRTPNGETVLDFQENIAGIFEFVCRAKKGERLTLKAGEILQEGNFYRDNLRAAKAEFNYTSDGKAKLVRPTFTYYGFRYLLLEGFDNPDPKDFTALVLQTELPLTLSCTTSHAGINQLMKNTLRGQRSNFMDIATDCPQRSERLGWTGDTQVFAATACYQMDCLPFYEKIMRDLMAEQEDCDGNLPNYVPSLHHETGAGCAVWSDIATILPLLMYTWYADKDLLEKTLPLMEGYCDFLMKRDAAHGDTHLYHEGGFGDWLAGDGVCDQSFVGGTDVGFISAVYYRNSLLLTAEAARILGKDASVYEEKAREVYLAVLEEYFAPNGRFCLDTQTAYVLSLYYGIYRDKEQVKAALRSRLERDFFKIKTGFTGTPLILPVLFDNDMEDLAYSLLLNEELPGWLYAVKMGATSVWERWNSVMPDGKISGTGMNSLNHYAYGSVCQTIYAYIAGLKPAAPGWKEALIAPHPDYRMKHISLQYDSPAGTYTLAWELLANGDFSMKGAVPCGCRAQLHLPDGSHKLLEAGPFSFTVTPVKDYLHPFTSASYLRDLLAHEETAAALKKHLPQVYGAATGENPEFLTMTLENMAHIPMWGGAVDLTAAQKSLAEISA